MITYTAGDVTRPHGDGPKVIAHIVNNEGKWGAGFVVALSRRWSEPEQAYRDWCRVPTNPSWCQGEGLPRLGNVQFVRVHDDITVANMMAQDGIRRGPSAPRAVRYAALMLTLAKVAAFAASEGSSVHMPRIGCGLGGGRWADIEPMIDNQMCRRGIPVTVYGPN